MNINLTSLGNLPGESLKQTN